MGETNITPSKRKSLSLIKKKKKRSHDLDKVDKKKMKMKKKKSSRSKIRKSKSKKLRRRDNSSSYSVSDDGDGDESLKSLSSSDSFFDDHKRQRSRSRTGNDGKKKSKKRTRKRSPSSESESQRDERRRVKKRKGSKRNIDSDTKKKSRRKKHKRDVKVSSSSSSSSSSLSCSISCGGSSYEDSGRNGSKRRRYRSPSCSSIRRSSEGDDYQIEENWVSENTSRRLRSVITVVKEPGEKELELDKEEIIHEQDDYPSCRSNDSDDAKTKIDEEMKGAQDYAVMGIDVNDRYEVSYPSTDEYEGPRQVIEKKNEDFTNDEIILRQRALENLIKFREELKIKATTSDPKGQKDDAIKQSPPVMAGLLPCNEDDAKVPSTVNASQENTKPTMLKVDDRSLQHRRRSEAPELAKGKEDGRKLPSTNKGVDQIGMVRKLRNSITSMQDGRKLQEGKYTSEDTVKNSKPNTSVHGREPQDVRSFLKQVPTSQQRPKSNVDSIATEITKPSLDIRDDSGKQVNNNAKQVPTSQQGPKSKVDSNAAEISKPSLIRDDIGRQVNNSASVSSVSDPSSVKPETGEQSSKFVQGETKDTSQYEQKTMSVMRGGEMVQVSYKVYIPKKTPALARRKLQLSGGL